MPYFDLHNVLKIYGAHKLTQEHIHTYIHIQGGKANKQYLKILMAAI